MACNENVDIQRVFETYLIEQNKLQTQIAGELVTIARQQKALLLIFGQAAEAMEKRK